MFGSPFVPNPARLTTILDGIEDRAPATSPTRPAPTHPVLSRVEDQVNLRTGTGALTASFGLNPSQAPLLPIELLVNPVTAVYDGTLTPTETGTYQLGMRALGSFRVFVDGQELIARDRVTLDNYLAPIERTVGQSYDVRIVSRTDGRAQCCGSPRPNTAVRFAWVLPNDAASRPGHREPAGGDRDRATAARRSTMSSRCSRSATACPTPSSATAAPAPRPAALGDRAGGDRGGLVVAGPPASGDDDDPIGRGAAEGDTARTMPGQVGTLLSVNVGLPKDVSWQGRTVFTGVFKDPVNGPRRARRLNLDGDGQGDLAGHGGEQRAVFVYQIDSYKYWERELGRDDLVYGQFGENFTVEGLADAEVCVGDRYRIGTAVFEVSQPRVTCYRVGIRMNDPRIPALLVSHRRPGFYFRVLEEGDVEAGDAIVKLAAGPEAMTVADVDALLYLPGHTREQLRRALRIPALSPGWQGSFRALLEGGDQGSGNAGLAVTSPPPAWPGFRRLAVTAITHESDTVIAIRFEDPDGAPLPPARPGQYLTLRVQAAGDGRALLRNYSLSGPPDGGFYRIAVKREQDGAASGYLHARLAVGDQLDVAAPRGTFILDDGARAPVLLVSAGIGATPVLAMLQALAEERSDREIWWLHGARSGSDHPFAAEARTLLARLPHASIHVYYSRPGPHDVEGRDYDRAGRLTAAALADLDPPRQAEAYVCGPAPFMDDISAGLAAIGFDGPRIHTEPFGPAAGLTPGIAAAPARTPHLPAGEPGAGPTIEFARSNLAIPWSSEYTNLLELAEACDVPVRWSCRTGVCHTCETTLIAGDVDYDPDPVEPPAGGSALICCSRPRADVVLDL